MKNFEVGTKNTFADGRIRLNATYFDMQWKDYQLEVVDPSNVPCAIDPTPPCGQPWQKGVLNAGNAHSDGFEISIDALPSENFKLQLNATVLESELDDEVPGVDAVGKGSKLPFAPEFKASMLAQYNWPMAIAGSNEGFFQFQFSHVGDSLNQVQAFEGGPTPQIKQSAYNIGDLKFGINGDDWSVQLFVNNVTDERAVLFANPYEFDYFFGHGRETINRPREFGIRYSKSFGN